MGQNKIVTGAGLAVIAAAAVLAIVSSGIGGTQITISAPTSTVDGGNAAMSSVQGGASSGYTLADVAKHASQSSCWSAINGTVYDLTSWISKHPGGESAILSICGKDGSAAFNNQHGGQRKPEQELASLPKIGALAQ